MELSPVRNEATTKAPQVSEKTSEEPKTTDVQPKTDGTDFESFMRQAIQADPQGQTNEEELFAALVEQRLSKISPEAQQAFAQEKQKLMVSMRRADGYVSYEDVTNTALMATVNSGAVDTAAAESIKGEAFAAAQLDNNKDALYDGRGSANDPTIAVATLETAMLAMKGVIDKVDSGELTGLTRSLNAPTTGSSPTATLPNGADPGLGGQVTPSEGPSGAQPLDGDEGFLWKPVSESDGNLVVLLPTELRKMVSKVEIHSALPPSDLTKLDEGRFTGDEHNGMRPHYRFPKEGSEYGDNVHVVVYKNDGETVTYQVQDGSSRND